MRIREETEDEQQKRQSAASREGLFAGLLSLGLHFVIRFVAVEGIRNSGMGPQEMSEETQSSSNVWLIVLTFAISILVGLVVARAVNNSLKYSGKVEWWAHFWGPIVLGCVGFVILGGYALMALA